MVRMRVGLLIAAMFLIALAVFTKWSFAAHVACVLVATACFFGAAARAKAL